MNSLWNFGTWEEKRKVRSLQKVWGSSKLHGGDRIVDDLRLNWVVGDKQESQRFVLNTTKTFYNCFINYEEGSFSPRIKGRGNTRPKRLFVTSSSLLLWSCVSVTPNPPSPARRFSVDGTVFLCSSGHLSRCTILWLRRPVVGMFNRWNLHPVGPSHSGNLLTSCSWLGSIWLGFGCLYSIFTLSFTTTNFEWFTNPIRQYVLIYWFCDHNGY